MNRITYFILVFLLCISSICSTVYAQKVDSSILKIADVIKLHSKILNEDRKIYIYTPYLNADPAAPKAPCPVMYILDAEYQLTMTAGLVDYLSKAQAIMPNMIIVGIDNNDYERERDLTPTHSDKADPVSAPTPALTLLPGIPAVAKSSCDLCEKSSCLTLNSITGRSRSGYFPGIRWEAY